MVKDWIANAYGGLSRREFLAQMGAVGIGLAGFALASTPVSGAVITTLTNGLIVTDGKVDLDGFQIPIYEARPGASGKFPIVLVIPEIFGMHEHIKDVTRRFASEGFLAITFEPYAREGGVLHLPDIESVLKVANQVPDDRVMRDLEAVMDYAQKQTGGRSDRVGVTGFCRGGLYTLLFAAHKHDVKAAVAWYGQIRPDKTPGIRTEGPLDLALRINAPVLGLYGGADLGIPLADVKEMEAALQAAGRTAEFLIYGEAPHAFFADYRPSYRPEAARDAWAHCLSWFNKYLKG